VLDNFEHLMDGALLVSELLEACPNVSIVVTSRERLQLEEEHALPVQGLPVPKEARFAEAEYLDAIKLFVQRAKRARLDFELTPENLPFVLEICNLVEGSPLGIELAAVWLRSLPIAEIAREIGQNLGMLETSSRNIAQRHQSLRAVFEHSWKLLKPKEQQTLARLTVFADGFRREAAGQVGDATIPLLTSLVDKSLLRLSLEGRYDFHPLLYQYAAEKLAGTPEEKEQTRARHNHYVLTLIEASQKAEAQTHIRCCNDEHQNVLAALAWSRDQATLGLRLANAFAPFWETQGYVSEGRQWIATLLSHPGAAAPTEERARALLCAGRMASRQSDRVLAVRYGNEAMALCQALGLDAVSIRVFVLLANEASLQGDVEGGKKHAEAGLALARKLGDDELVAATLVKLGSLAEWLGRLDEAWALFEESLSLLRKLGRQKSPEYPLNLSNLGYIAWLRGDLKTAKTLLEEAIVVARTLDHLFLTCIAQDNLGVVMLDLGDLASSYALGSQVLEYRRAQNDRWGMAFSLENFASLAVEQKDAQCAARLWGVAERLREEIHAPMVASWQSRQERFAARAKSQIGEASFRSASQEGRSMGLEEAVNYAFDATRSLDLQFAAASLLDP
jgi:predicted ATPase